MPDSELKHQSQIRLNALGESLAKAFSVDGILDNESIDALMERLDELNVSRDFALESACQRTNRLLSNTSNQVI